VDIYISNGYPKDLNLSLGYLKFYGENIMPKVKKIKILVSLPEDLVQQIDILAAKRRLNRSTLIQLILEEYLRNHEE